MARKDKGGKKVKKPKQDKAKKGPGGGLPAKTSPPSM